MNYNLEGNTAAINMTVINEGDTNMPFSFGFHPYFKASKLENVDFDIHCATCSESAKGGRIWSSARLRWCATTTA